MPRRWETTDSHGTLSIAKSAGICPPEVRPVLTAVPDRRNNRANRCFLSDTTSFTRDLPAVGGLAKLKRGTDLRHFQKRRRMYSEYSIPVGIDLGTTFSATAWVQANGRTTMIPNQVGDTLTPSAVLFEEAAVIVGRDARRQRLSAPDRLAELVKRDMGKPVYSKPIHGNYLPPEAIQACILRQMQADIARLLGENFQVVIGVPAFFDDLRRRATATAAEMAGLKLLDIVSEPTAAALAFGEALGYLSRDSLVREPMKVVVYDLGGGTFDVTLVELAPGQFRTVATDGDVQLGGADWDQRLVDYCADKFIQQFRTDPRQHPISLNLLISEAEAAKHTLSGHSHTRIRVNHAGQSLDVPITRAEFEQLTQDLLRRTAHTTQEVLRAGNCEWKDVKQLLLVGGSTRMPMVRRMLQELSGLDPEHAVHPDEAVARGTALYAKYLLDKQTAAPGQAGLQVTGVNAHSLGVQGVDVKTGRKKNVILIPRNSKLPAEKTKKFVTKNAGQASIIVPVLEGESTVPSACQMVGRMVIRDLPRDLPQGSAVQVTFAYGENGRLSVKVHLPGSGIEKQLELENEGQLTSQQAAQWRQVLNAGMGLRTMAGPAN